MEIFGTIRAPREIIFGSGQRRVLPKIAARLGKRALIVTDERMLSDPALEELIQGLFQAGIAYQLCGDTLPDVPVDSAQRAAESARRFGPDLVIGIGGGSCLDMAKCVALLLSHGGRPQDYYGELKVPGPILPMIALPTTAGTGSEVTPVAVLSDAERVLKVGISSPYLIPTVAICDPELTLSCPPGLTAVTGADALTHALEAYTARQRPLTAGLTQERVFIGKNALSDEFALKAIALIWDNLEIVHRDGSDLAARSKVMQGATFAGLAFGVAGTAAAHAIQYPLGALTHSSHGAGVACLMPWVLDFNRPSILKPLQEIASHLGIASPEQLIKDLAQKFARLGIPPTLKALGLAEEKLPEVAAQAAGIERLILNNPRDLTQSDLLALVSTAFHGRSELLSCA